MKKHEVREKEGFREVALLEAAREGYLKAKLPRAVGTGFEIQTRFTAWGTELRSQEGKCGAPIERRKQLFFLLDSQSLRTEVLLTRRALLLATLCHFHCQFR